MAVTVLASLTLLPALLGFAGERVELTRWRGLIAAGLVAVALVGVGLKHHARCIVGLPLAVIVLDRRLLRRPAQAGGAPPAAEAAAARPPAYRWSRVIQHRPWPAAIAGAAGPARAGRCPCSACASGFSDESNYAEDTTTKQAYDLLVDGLRRRASTARCSSSPSCPRAPTSPTSTPITEAVAADPGVAFVSAAQPNDPDDPTAVLWNARARRAGPQDEATTELVDRLRDDVLPPAEDAAGVDVAVTGTVAVNVDFSDYLDVAAAVLLRRRARRCRSCC